ncbi:hypothetical protein PR202_ga04787 [Eleusine coracana subsp. coracana]|uniref:Uncharacterized protein n=1 Tax=Eleusine coracana subsp. coracana TaxID=191504 RepID=A0AAV5BQS2_ELECO|nr:hypothetical protein PR202_ga04787 [Eleusine coracana subsp. coracana]
MFFFCVGGVEQGAGRVLKAAAARCLRCGGRRTWWRRRRCSSSSSSPSGGGPGRTPPTSAASAASSRRGPLAPSWGSRRSCPGTGGAARAAAPSTRSSGSAPSAAPRSEDGNEWPVGEQRSDRREGLKLATCFSFVMKFEALCVWKN